jgi:serine/threonine-protein kinase
MTGVVPFEGEGMGEVLIRQVNEPPVPPRSRNPHIPPSVEAVLLRALHKRPEHRFQSMRELRAALLDPEAYAASEPGAAATTRLPAFSVDVLPPDAPTPPPVFADRLSPAPPHRVEVRMRTERRGWMWLLVALATAGVAAAVLLVVLRGRTTAAPREEPAPASVAPPAPDAAAPTPVVEPLPPPPPERAPDPPPPAPTAAKPRPKPKPAKPAKPPPKPGDEILEPTF